MNSITKRWVRGSLLITIVVMLLAEALFVYFTVSNYYDAARRALQARSSTLLTQLSLSDAQTEEARGIVLRRMVEQFSERDKFEFTILNAAGRAAITTMGYTAPRDDMPEDVRQVFSGESSVGITVYRTATGEKVMACTVPLPESAEGLTALRLVTSLTLMDKTIRGMIYVSVLLALVIVLFSIWSGMFFVRSIVRPIGEIEHTAAKIAEGNLDIRIENKYNDEIGKLSDTINHMAGELDKTERMKNEFISSVSHELRTPLTSIKGWVETIAAVRDPADETYRRGVQVIARETDRLYDMVEELLDFSRLQNGVKLELHTVDLVAEVSDSVLTVEPRAQMVGVRMAYEEPALPIAVLADAGRLRQVMLNILDNAIKYSPDGGEIAVSVQEEDNMACVRVRDGGPGISPEDLENVKMKFFKGKGAVRGSGIGLAVVDELVRAHGGTVEITSTLGCGTTVAVRLPLYKK